MRQRTGSAVVGAAAVAVVLLLVLLGAGVVLAGQVPDLVVGDDEVTARDDVVVVAAGLAVVTVVVGTAMATGSWRRLSVVEGGVLDDGGAGGGAVEDEVVADAAELRRAVRRRGLVETAAVAQARAVARALAAHRLAAWPLAGLPLYGVALLAAAERPTGVVVSTLLLLGGIVAVALLARDGSRGQAFLAAHPEPAALRAWLTGHRGEAADREAAAAALRRRWLVAAILVVLLAPAVVVPLVPRGPDALAPAPPATWRALAGITLGVVGAVLLVLGGLAAWRGGQVDRWLRSPVWGLPAHRRRRLVLRLRLLEPVPEPAMPQVRALAAHLAQQGPTFVLLTGMAVTLLGRGVGSPFTTTVVLSLVAVATVLGLLVALGRAAGEARRFLRAHPASTEPAESEPART